MQPDMSR